MAEQALVPRAESDKLAYVQRLGNILVASGYFADAREMAQAAVKVMAGEELGIPPIAAMMGIYVVKGKVVLSGNLIASRIRAHGYDYRHKQFDNKGCVLVFLSKAAADGKREVLGESSFTEEDAKTAGLLGSDTYKKYPRNMMFNRAISNGAKWFTPEVTCGLPVYTAEELGATVDSEGDIVHQEGSRAAQQQVAEQKLTALREKQSEEGSSAVERHLKLAAMKPETVPTVDDEPAELLDLYAEMKDYGATLKVIGKLKDNIVELTGEDREYYSILAHNGLSNRTDIKGKRGAGRAVVKALYEFTKRVRESQAEPKHVDILDEDVPLFGALQPEKSAEYPE